MYPLPLPPASGKLTHQLEGMWLLKSREDYTPQGEKRYDPTLGAEPLGILAYQAGNFTAQFMKKDRSDILESSSYSGANNTRAVGGYDAYFGVYEVNEETGRVLHTLKGSINNDNIGLSVWRDLRVVDNELIIQLETTTMENEKIIRTLVWDKV